MDARAIGDPALAYVPLIAWLAGVDRARRHSVAAPERVHAGSSATPLEKSNRCQSLSQILNPRIRKETETLSSVLAALARLPSPHPRFRVPGLQGSRVPGFQASGRQTQQEAPASGGSRRPQEGPGDPRRLQESPKRPQESPSRPHETPDPIRPRESPGRAPGGAGGPSPRRLHEARSPREAPGDQTHQIPSSCPRLCKERDPCVWNCRKGCAREDM